MKATKIKQLFFYTLATAVSPAGGGSLTVSPLKNNYTATDVVILTATPAVGYSFTGWSGDLSGTTNPRTITMNRNYSVTANFLADTPPDLYTLTTAVSPAGSGSITISPLKGSYAQNELVTLTAVPASGNTFLNWSGSASGSSNPTILTMNANKSVTAWFDIPVAEMEVPAGGIILYVNTNTPTGFAKVDGLMAVRVSPNATVNKTPTSAGLANHTHTYPVSSSVADHSHSASCDGVGGGGGTTYYGGGTSGVAPSHSHSASISSTGSAGVHTHAGGSVGDPGFVQVPFRYLNYIKNTSGGLKIAPVGSIVMIDSGVTIPDGWALCNGANGTQDMRERFPWGATANGDLLVAGGSKTHSHPAVTTASAGAHSHSISVSFGGASGVSGYCHPSAAGGDHLAKSGHSHGAGSGTTDQQAAHTHTYPATNAADHMPPYVYMYYIQRIT